MITDFKIVAYLGESSKTVIGNSYVTCKVNN